MIDSLMNVVTLKNIKQIPFNSSCVHFCLFSLIMSFTDVNLSKFDNA